VSDRPKAYALYLADIHQEYDARLERLSSEISLSAFEVEPESANGDIETLIQIVMLATAKDAEEDLRQVIEEMKAAAQVRRRLRDAIANLRTQHEAVAEKIRDEYANRDRRGDRCHHLDIDLAARLLITIALRQSDSEMQTLADEIALTREHIRRSAVTDEPQAKLDVLNELAEMEQMRLQIFLERRSKMLEWVSNIMKKTADTSAAIAQNLK
jgi:hypothetical protein